MLWLSIEAITGEKVQAIKYEGNFLFMIIHCHLIFLLIFLVF